ncbi:type IV toxin-antitoxin system AbiEi family antitoxin domain-containing protein [Nakamurella deserti]|uniref:type IV toxin-antitoxin system AbiEi family antitoxin domain-containing protein n=1 Tax=Nakamurella deserti TaxID=2164074 RepID=UPI000DBE939A|nr:type IV toxin-antitoxin system AbiEi family antitoxin domain-containing protein [Nakamurella deserti]
MQDLRLIARQEGLISRQQALTAGLSPSAITRRISTGQWVRVLPGVYRHLASPVSDLMWVHAAQLWLGRAMVLHGNWAAWWHDLRPEPSGPVTVTVPRHARSRSHAYVKLRRRDLEPVDVVELRGVRVTTRQLTALENARLPDGQNTFDRALQRHVRVPELERTITRLWHAYGVIAARDSLSLATDGTVSPPERTLAAALRGAGVDQIRAGVTVVAGGRQFWLDFADVRRKLAIEVDGVKAHTDPAVFASDRTRQNLLIRDGWTVLRYTPWQIREDVTAIIAEIRSTLQLSG